MLSIVAPYDANLQKLGYMTVINQVHEKMVKKKQTSRENDFDSCNINFSHSSIAGLFWYYRIFTFMFIRRVNLN